MHDFSPVLPIVISALSGVATLFALFWRSREATFMKSVEDIKEKISEQREKRVAAKTAADDD